jgi:hypothetical protein
LKKGKNEDIDKGGIGRRNDWRTGCGWGRSGRGKQGRKTKRMEGREKESDGGWTEGRTMQQ